jgi:succinate dehydrogenase flavin-adding protein (antitoxin of CptAB toxin-antitoxin module)
VLGNYLPSNINYTFNTDDHLIADTTYDKQKEMLENILNTEDTEIDEYLKNKEQKDQRQQELLNQILTG